jgi:plasmid maintenance system antidote protein VapI
MAEEFKGFSNETLKNAQSVRDSMQEISLEVRNINKELRSQAQFGADINKEFSAIVSSAAKVADLQNKALKGSQGTADALKEQQKQLNIVRTLNVKIDELYNKAEISSGKTKENFISQARNLASARDNAKELASDIGQIANDSAKLDNKTQFFDGIAQVAKDIPGLRKLSGPFEAAAEAARKTVLENAKGADIRSKLKNLTDEELKTGKGLSGERLKQLGLEDVVGKKRGSAAAQSLRAAQTASKTQSVGLAGMSAGFKALGPIIKTAFGPFGLIMAAVEAIKMFIEASFAADKRVTEIAKGLSIGKEAARGIYSNLTDLKGSLDSVYATTTNIVAAYTELASLTEFTTSATKDQVETQIVLTKQLGQSVDEALALQGIFAVNNVEANEGLDIVYDQIAAFANQNKMIADGRQILKQVQGVSKQVLLNFRGNTGELVKTVLQANKLGLSLDQVNKIAGSLLDFEQSIEAELSAELITGKQLNLDKARQFALTNDIAGLTQEINNQGVTAAEFAKMNRIEQEAIAGAFGMQASEMADMLFKQELIRDTGGQTLKNLKEEVKLLEAKGNKSEAIALQQQIAQIEQGILQGKTVQEAQKSVDAQEKFNLALERAKEIFTDVIDGGLLDSLVDALDDIVIGLERLGFGNRDARLAREREKIKEKQGDSYNEENIKALQEKASPSLTRSIITSMVSAINPLYGMYANTEQDVSRAQLKGITADDFTIRTHPKDELVIAGGTNLSGGSNQEMIGLLQKLVSATEQSRQVTVSVDGEAVFSAMGRVPMK